MTYYQTHSLSGSPAKAVELLRNQFIYSGFRLTELTPTGFTALNSDKIFDPNRNLMGAISQITVEGAGKTLTVEARMGGLTRLAIFAGLIILIICISIMTGGILDARNSSQPFPFPVLASPLILLILASILNTMRRKVRKRLDILAANAVLVADLYQEGRP